MCPISGALNRSRFQAIVDRLKSSSSMAANTTSNQRRRRRQRQMAMASLGRLARAVTRDLMTLEAEHLTCLHVGDVVVASERRFCAWLCTAATVHTPEQSDLYLQIRSRCDGSAELQNGRPCTLESCTWTRTCCRPHPISLMCPIPTPIAACRKK